MRASESCCSSYEQQQQQQQQQQHCCGGHSHSPSSSAAAAAAADAAADAAAPAAAAAAAPSAAAAAAAAAAAYSFCRYEADTIGKRLDDLLKRENLKTLIPSAAERAARVYNNVIQKGKKDGLSMEKGSADDLHLHEEILKEALVREIQLKVAHEMRQEQLLDSREGGLLANPSAYDEGPLCFLKPETIRDLMVDGVAVQQGFIGEE
ncbi:hypothetical protein ETH_00037990, partial [Eimeria tenella]